MDVVNFYRNKTHFWFLNFGLVGDKLGSDRGYSEQNVPPKFKDLFLHISRGTQHLEVVNSADHKLNP